MASAVADIMNATIRINTYRSRKDNRVNSFDAPWDDIATTLTQDHQPLTDKFHAHAFNGVRYKELQTLVDQGSGFDVDERTGEMYVPRWKENIEQVELLVLDFDDTLRLETAKERFRDYEYAGYTSYRHRVEPNVEKFRLVFPLATPIPASEREGGPGRSTQYGDWYYLRDAINKFAGPVDPACFNANQIYLVPAVHPSRQATAYAWRNRGKWLDWSTFEKRTPGSDRYDDGTSSRLSGHSKRSARYLDPDQLLHFRHGAIPVALIKGKIEGVVCPFHEDKHGSEFARRTDSGHVFLYCKRCDQTFYMRRPADDDVVGTNQSKKTKTTNTKPVSKIELLEGVPTPDYRQASRERVKKQLNKIKRAILRDNIPKDPRVTYSIPYKAHIVYLPEGAGKSQLAIDFVREGRKVVFACKSWEQVFEKYQDYSAELFKHGMRAEIAFSREGRIRHRFKVAVKRKSPRDPFTPGDILVEETITRIAKAHPKLSEQFIRVCWAFLGADERRFEDMTTSVYRKMEAETGIDPEMDEDVAQLLRRCDMILTTYAQLRLLASKHDRIPIDWMIWFDDPGIDDVIDISPDTKREPEDDEEPGKRQREIDGFRYITRKPEQSLGYAVRHHRCVYTTTELVTLEALQLLFRNRRQSFIVHDQMEKIESGTITVLGTKAVRRRFDGVIPLIARRLEKKGFKIALIADGLCSRFNHTNSKGQNALNKTNVLVEMSVPHPMRVLTICHALGFDYKRNRHDVARKMMLDQLHQAIGRNSGYRWEGLECVALVEKTVHSHIREHTRYWIDPSNSVIIDRTKRMSRKDRRISDSASKMVQEIEALLTNINTYLSDDRLIRPDIDYVLKGIKDENDRYSYLARLLIALTFYGDVEFDGSVKPVGLVQEKCLGSGQWALKKWAGGKRKVVLTLYRKMLDEIHQLQKAGDEGS